MNIQELNQFIETHKSKFDQAFPEGWFLTGSSYTVSKGLITRDIHDIDIMTVGDHYKDGECRWIIDNRQYSFESGKFYDDEGNLIKCFKMYLDGVTLDIMHNPSAKEDNVLEQIIKYKVRGIKNDGMHLEARLKHYHDLQDMVHYCDVNCGRDKEANNLIHLLAKYHVFVLMDSDWYREVAKGN